MLFSELENDTFRLQNVNQAELINEIKIKCSNFSKNYGVDIIAIVIVPIEYSFNIDTQGLVTIHVNILSMYKHVHVQGRTSLYILLIFLSVSNFKCLLLVFCFAVIISFVYFVRRGLHISWYNLLSNPIVYVH
jgi:hypothetical protein